MSTSGRAGPGWLPRAVPGLVVGGAGALAAGVVIGLGVDASALVGSEGYLFTASLLLAVGLYGSTYAIDLKALRADLPGVVAAVTVGVVLKAALIAGTMALVLRRPEALVLGIAVAQIDPLSVAALERGERMSPRARSLLKAWASFDDPMTVLLTLYLAGYAYAAAGHEGTPRILRDGTGGYLTGLVANAALLAAVLLLWWAGRAVAARLPESRSGSRAGAVAAVVLVVVTLVLAADRSLMLAVALAGLFVRSPLLGRLVGRAVGGAYLAAFLALGMLLAHGVAWWPGFVLGSAAFVAQAVVALVVMPLFVRGLERRDRIALGLGQQNGITAVLIALSLERDFPGTAATVGPAVITVTVLHGTGQLVLARLRAPGGGPGPRRPRGELEAAGPRPSPLEAGADDVPQDAQQRSVA
ncbi:hypothetical protein [Streptomyces sp. NPDC096132]|uniref:hypothetical protein n=1 Tax=Streptomyces sp. NPDC096132 TaxID=3366075 RepID=UPI00380FE066